MSDLGEGVWRTVRGRRIFIGEGQDLQSAMEESGKFEKTKITNMYMNKKIREVKGYSLQAQHKSKIAELNKPQYSDGTYDVDTLKPVEFKDGYQVSFYQTGVKLNDRQYQNAHNDMSKYSDGKVYAGKFGGEPEISYHVRDRQNALMLMKKYNQHSIAQFTKTGKVRFYYNYDLDEGTNKVLYKKGGH